MAAWAKTQVHTRGTFSKRTLLRTQVKEEVSEGSEHP